MNFFQDKSHGKHNKISYIFIVATSNIFMYKNKINYFKQKKLGGSLIINLGD
jgi:hypothetical protein